MPARKTSFNPRTSCEVRLPIVQEFRPVDGFNPRTSCEVRPGSPGRGGFRQGFNPRTSCEVRLDKNGQSITYRQFQSTHLV